MDLDEIVNFCKDRAEMRKEEKMGKGLSQKDAENMVEAMKKLTSEVEIWKRRTDEWNRKF